ncbi:MAG: response regulator [Myxococcota bacterium]
MGARVLIVDDHALVLKALRRLLARHYDVRAAATVDDALQVGGEAAVDVVVTDLELEDPDGRDGIWLLEAFEARWGIRGLMLTGGSEEYEGIVVLRKPTSPELLRAAIDGLVAPGAFGSPQV